MKYAAVYAGLCLLSLLLFAAGLWRMARLSLSRKAPPLNRLLVTFSLFLLPAVWLLRLSVGLYQIGRSGLDLSWFEALSDSLVHALQTFSMDEDYTAYILGGKEMLRSLFGPATAWAGVYGAYAAALNVLAPFAGGAILFDILTSVFPRLQLALQPRRRVKYVFSELNDRSLALAKSIRQEKDHRGTILFTDAYVDHDEEMGAERLASAKALGAICLSDDILNLGSRLGPNARFFLMDDSEEANLHTLSALTEAPYIGSKMLKNSEIYLFSQSDLAGELMKRTAEAFRAGVAEEDVPLLRVVPGQTNLIYGLLSRMPLYEPLVGTHQKELHLTVLGTGPVGTEMFLASTWCGQILDVALHIHLVSLESEGDFRSRIDAISPEILRSATPGDPILRIYPQGEELAQPYFHLHYTQTDLSGDGLRAYLLTPDETGFRPVDSDYFLSALGSDQRNLTAANVVRRNVGAARLTDRPEKKATLAYILYDRSLSYMVNGGSDSGNLRMYAFGSSEQVYSCRNVFMTSMESDAFALCQNYSKRDMAAFLKDEYGWRANMARALHLKYKRFSAGAVTGDPDPQAELARYKDRVTGPDRTLFNRLTWLEHRRWNAFIRSQGFTCPTGQQLQAYAYRDGNTHKCNGLRLHPCLVESDDGPMKPMDYENGCLKDPRQRCDCLDELSLHLYKLSGGARKEDLKLWDCPYMEQEDGTINLS